MGKLFWLAQSLLPLASVSGLSYFSLHYMCSVCPERKAPYIRDHLFSFYFTKAIIDIECFDAFIRCLFTCAALMQNILSVHMGT